jgi:hypothetical protein
LFKLEPKPLNKAQGGFGKRTLLGKMMVTKLNNTSEASPSTEKKEGGPTTTTTTKSKKKKPSDDKIN